MKMKIKYYFGNACGVYAVNESRPNSFCHYAPEWRCGAAWESAKPYKNKNVVEKCCLPTPATISEIKKRYPKFRPLK